MKKVAKFFVTIILLLTACQTTKSDTTVISLQQVLSAFEEQQLSLQEIKVDKNDTFEMKINGIRTYSYELNGKKY